MDAARLGFSVVIALLSPLLACGEPTPATEEAQETPPPDQDVPRAYRGLPAGTSEGSPTSLLAQYSLRDPIDPREPATWRLPDQGKRIAVALLTTAALDRLEDLPMLLTPDARWGLPDRREYQAQPVFTGDDGARFFDVLRGAASRFRGVDPNRENPAGGSASFSCPPLVPGAQNVVSTGAEPYWCFYQSDDRLDLLVFKLRATGGRARIEYVGMFEERPRAPVAVPRAEPAPPLTPPVRMPDSAMLEMQGLSTPPPRPPRPPQGAPVGSPPGQ